MCGTYYIARLDPYFLKLKRELERALREKHEQLQIVFEGDVRPTDVAPVKLADGGVAPLQWGFMGSGGQLLINARSETALEKPTFAESMHERRCLIPANGYYEWEGEKGHKTRYRFELPEQSETGEPGLPGQPETGEPERLGQLGLPGQPEIGERLLWLAGCWRQERAGELPRFVILTREATPAFAAIHPRMPVIIPPEHAASWLRTSPDAMHAALTNLDYHFQ